MASRLPVFTPLCKPFPQWNRVLGHYRSCCHGCCGPLQEILVKWSFIFSLISMQTYHPRTAGWVPVIGMLELMFHPSSKPSAQCSFKSRHLSPLSVPWIALPWGRTEDTTQPWRVPRKCVVPGRWLIQESEGARSLPGTSGALRTPTRGRGKRRPGGPKGRKWGGGAWEGMRLRGGRLLDPAQAAARVRAHGDGSALSLRRAGRAEMGSWGRGSELRWVWALPGSARTAGVAGFLEACLPPPVVGSAWAALPPAVWLAWPVRVSLPVPPLVLVQRQVLCRS